MAEITDSRTGLGYHVASTLSYYREKMADTVTKRSPVLNMLRSKGAIQLSGGADLKIPIMTGLNTDDQLITELDTMPTMLAQNQDGEDLLSFKWGMYTVPITVSELHRLMNMDSKNRIKEMVKGKIKKAQSTMSMRMSLFVLGETLPAHLASASTQQTYTPGIKHAILSPTYAQNSSYSYGGKARSTTWGNKFQDATIWPTGNVTDFDTAGVGMLDAMENVHDSCTELSGMAPDLVLMSRVAYTLYKSLLRSTERIVLGSMGKPDVIGTGHDSVVWHGKDVVWDPQLTAATTSGRGDVYFINTESMNLYLHRACNFKVYPYQEYRADSPKFAGLGRMATMFSVACDNLATCGIVHDIAAST